MDIQTNYSLSARKRDLAAVNMIKKFCQIEDMAV